MRFLLGSQFVVIAKIAAQAEVERSLGVAGGELVAIAGEIEIERVAWVKIDEDQISISHDQLSEPNRRAARGHVIAGYFRRGHVLSAILLQNLIAQLQWRANAHES